MAEGSAQERHIDCSRLKSLLDDSNAVFLIDARPYSDFVVGHIRNAVSTRLSSILIRRLGKGSIGVADLLVEDQKDAYESHRTGAANFVVVYDQSSSAPCFKVKDKKNPLHVLLAAVQKECEQGFYLEGGIDALQASHADLVEASTDVRSPSPFLVLGNTPGIGPLSPQTPVVETPGALTHHHARDLQPSEILPYLMIGAQTHAQDSELLKSLRITAILNMTPSCPNHFVGDFEYKNIPIRDSWNQNLQSFFTDAFEFIDSCNANGGRVLIHCVAGISRSAAITIAYIMRKQNLSLADAYSLVKSKRPSISPNLDFMGELQMYEKKILPPQPSPLQLHLPVAESCDFEDSDASPVGSLAD